MLGPVIAPAEVVEQKEHQRAEQEMQQEAEPAQICPVLQRDPRPTQPPDPQIRSMQIVFPPGGYFRTR